MYIIIASREPKFRAHTYVKKYYLAPRIFPPTGINVRRFIGRPFPTNLLFTALSVTTVFAVIFIADEISMLYTLRMKTDVRAYKFQGF